jgi:MFS transporter, VNT family, synaptic vesicle glycoprotein 2
MFFPEIIDKITTYSKHFPAGRATICEVLLIENEMTLNQTRYSSALRLVPSCSEKFENATFGYSVMLEGLYMVGFLVITLIINRVTKLSILTSILFGCAFSGFATQIITIPIASIYFFIVFMLNFLAVNVINSVTVDLFPTHLR